MNTTELQQRPEGGEASSRQDQYQQPQHLPSQEQVSDLSQQSAQLQKHHQQQGFDDMIWDELKMEQSREIQQHNHRLHQSGRSNNFNAYDAPRYHYPTSALPDNYQYRLNTLRQNLEPLQENLKPITNAISTAANVASTTAQEQYQKVLHSVEERRKAREQDVTYAGPYRFGAKRGRRAMRGVEAGRNENLEEFGLQGFTSNFSHLHNTGDLEVGGISSDPLLDEYDYVGIGTDKAGGITEQEPKSNFMILDNFRLAPKRDGWGAVANLDLFFASMYNYYHYKGLIPIVGRGLVELISLFFTLGLSVFLFVFLDWKKLYTCTDEKSCEDIGEYIIPHPFRFRSLWNCFVILYVILFSIYGIYSILQFVATTREALEAKYVFEDKLGISAAKLEGGAVEWHQVVSKLLNLQKSGDFRVAIDGSDSMKDELVICQRILRRENFMVAFFNLNLLDLTIPIPRKTWLCGGGFSRSTTRFYSKSLEWSIYFCVFSYMFNHKYQIRPSFYSDPTSLQRRFRLCGVIHALLTPFILCFMTWHFFMNNVYDFNSSKQYLGPKEWSSVAKWTFREFNELPYAFERRLGPSYQAAEEYLKLFAPSAIMNAIGRVLMFLSGSLGFVALALGTMNDAILLHVKIGNWNLLWYVGIIAAMYSVGKSLIPDSTTIPRYHHNLFADMDSALMRVSSHTHYCPEYWKKRGWDEIIKTAFCELFQNKAKLFALEFLSVIVAPVVLCVSLPPCSWDLCSFIESVRVEIPGTGEHCGYATFDFDRFEDENWEGQKMGPDLSHSSIAVSQNQQSNSGPKARHGKMEKSFFNFKSVHPEWKCSSSGQDLIDRMSSYQHQQALADAKERQLHIAAARRQLEMLRKLEGGNDSGMNLNEMDDQYLKVNLPDIVPRNQSMGNENTFETLDGTALDGDLDNAGKDEVASPLSYEEGALSTELELVLNHSNLDPGTLTESLMNSEHSLGSLSKFQHSVHRHKSDSFDDERSRETKLQKQYLMLQKFHDQDKLSRTDTL